MPSKNKFWQVKNQKDGNSEILIYGPIASQASWHSDNVSPKAFAEDLEKLGGNDVTIRINSGGGDVFAAHAIHNQLINYKGKVTVVIDGLAASAATIIAMAGEKIIMPSNSMMMIHNPAVQMSDYYGADDLQSVVDALKSIKGSIIAAYTKRCKLSTSKLEEMMDAETWMGAQECLDYGFADEIKGSITSALNDNMLVINNVQYDLSPYKNASEIKKIINQKENKMSKLEEILNALGLRIDDNQNGVTDTATPTPVASAPVATATPAPVAPAPTAQDEATLVQNAVAAERQRVADLEAMDSGDNTAVTAIVNAAKKDGKTAEEIKPYVDAVRTATPPQQNTVANILENAVKDNAESGVNGIGANGESSKEAENATDAKTLDAMTAVINKKFGGAK